MDDECRRPAFLGGQICRSNPCTLDTSNQPQPIWRSEAEEKKIQEKIQAQPAAKTHITGKTAMGEGAAARAARSGAAARQRQEKRGSEQAKLISTTGDRVQAVLPGSECVILHQAAPPAHQKNATSPDLLPVFGSSVDLPRCRIYCHVTNTTKVADGPLVAQWRALLNRQFWCGALEARSTATGAPTNAPTTPPQEVVPH
ncbi:hypothetical protein C8R45DRAFT_928488 [Mycena sanguinolenta]|nr:hypothetical protein C8R45DRAFT_928488 [Mycena sanguinolenta]